MVRIRRVFARDTRKRVFSLIIVANALRLSNSTMLSPMLTADQLRTMATIMEESAKRAVGKDDDGIMLDHAAFEAITACVAGFLADPEDQDPATVDVLLSTALELLNELPVPTEEGEFLRQLGRRSGARR